MAKEGTAFTDADSIGSVMMGVDDAGLVRPMKVSSSGLTGVGAFSKTLSLTRTSDTNAYTANDVVGSGTGSGGAVLTFDGIGPALGGAVIITTVRLEVNLSSVPSGMTSFRLRLYGVTPPSALGDNAAWDLSSGDRAAARGYIDLGTPVDLGSTLEVETTQVNKQIVVASGGNLYGYLVTNGGYTPGSGDVFKIVLHSVAA